MNSLGVPAPMRWSIAAVALIGLAMTGCGQTGALTLPMPAPPPVSNPSRDSTEPANDSAETSADDGDAGRDER